MSNEIPNAFDTGGQTQPQAQQPAAPQEQPAQAATAVMEQQPVQVNIVPEPQDTYSQQMRTIFEQVTATDSKGGYVVENGNYVNYVPAGDEAVIRRMARKGWTLDTAYKPTPGMANYMRLIISMEKKDQMDREAAERTAASQGIRLKDETAIRDLDSNQVTLNEYKSAAQILHNLPDQADDIDES